VHNDGVIRRTALPALAAAVTLALAGCGGGASSSAPLAGGTDSESSPTSSASNSAADSAASGSSLAGTSSSAAVVDGVKLTPQGSELRVGDTAKVSWKPDQQTVAVAAISVTRLQRVPISAFSDWRLDPATQRSAPYFVHATVRNLGRSNLSGKAVPLYLLDGRNTLLQASTFQAQYAPCPSRPLPSGFRHGRKTSVCLVYFAPNHGKLVAISFRPTESFLAITWKGPLARH
jgi:hypothetical protein